MTTTTYQNPQPEQPTVLTRFIEGWRRFFYPSDFITLLVLCGLVCLIPLSLHSAGWPISLKVIIPTTVLSLVLGLLFARSRFGEFNALLLSSSYGVLMVLIFTSFSVEGNFLRSIYTVFSQLVEWIEAAFTGGIDQNDTIFTLLVAWLFWFLAYNAAWHTYRIDRIWRVIIPPGMILATNVIFDASDANLNIYLVVYLFLALVLLSRSNLDMREWDWYQRGIHHPNNLRQYSIYVGALLAGVILAIGYFIPSNDMQERLDSFHEFLQADPLQEMGELWNRLFSPIDAIGPASADYYGGDTLELGGAIRLGDQEVFWVEVPDRDRRYYWRSRTYDIYQNRRWSSNASIRLTNNSPSTTLQIEPNNAREMIQQRFVIGPNAMRIIHTAPQPYQVSLSTRSDLAYTAEESSPNRTMNISVIRPTSLIRHGESYTATSMMSTASAYELRNASLNYPDWVTDSYLSLPNSITGRTIELARQIVQEANAVTVYDQSKAIESYLRSNIAYNESIPTPPNNVDPVDWFLFTHQEGYCKYYASAMIVMLRSLGIPARMAAGFSQGIWDDARNAYVVTERDAHVWVEVYFPDYGWIEFEPTSAQTPLERDGDDQAPPPDPQVLPMMEQQPTLTPTPTPTPTAPPTQTPSPADDAQEDETDSPLNESQPTPTLTPTPTPVIIPTQPPPLPPESTDNPFGFVLPALGIFFALIFMAIVLFSIGLFIYWWWEWRGMRGLSPISRAYARLQRYLPLIGITPKDEETTEERRARVVRELPAINRPISTITTLYTHERYSSREIKPHQEQAVDEAWLDSRKGIIGRWLDRFKFWRRDD
jgi:transglutaminase-like putative cysteine protease